LNPSGGGLFQPGGSDGPAYAARITRAPLVLPFIDSLGNPASLIVPRESGVITANDARVRSQTLMRPHLRMLAGEEQEIFAGNNIPIPVSKAAADTANAFQTSQTVERQDVGIRLRVKPSVGEAGGVRLALDVDISALAPSVAGSVEEVGPTLRQRRLTSTIHLDDDEFAVVGFAREAVVEQSVTGTPWLKDIPILGWAFKQTSDTNVTARLVIAVQARIERGEDERVADSIRRRLAFERSRERLEPLADNATTAWALRVAARADEAEAQAIAARLSAGARPARVTRWESSSGSVFDVSVSGFATRRRERRRPKLRDEGTPRAGGSARGASRIVRSRAQKRPARR
jgi:type II secretory pathway component GspD/PulD (secretin)